MAKTGRIAIIGGGLGGLTAAQAVLRRGFEVSV
jgi:phytoene dehydrogenase-like protein